MSPGSELRMQSTTEPRGGQLEYLVGPGGVLTLTDDIYRNSIYQHKRRKVEEPVSVICSRRVWRCRERYIQHNFIGYF